MSLDAAPITPEVMATAIDLQLFVVIVRSFVRGSTP
jgi:hypothetical protein